MDNTKPQLILGAVESSNIKAIGYCEQTRVLAVQFKTNDLYIYPGVTPRIYAELLEAESHGSFLNSLKPYYNYTKIVPVA